MAAYRDSSPTRSLPGARRRFAATALLAALLIAALAGAAGARKAVDDPDRPGPGTLPWRVGGRMGFTVDAATIPDSSGLGLEVYVRIPPATLAALVEDPSGLDRLRISATLKGGYGARQTATTQDFTIEPHDSTGGVGRVVLLRFPVRPGLHRLEVKVEDPLSRKRGLAYLGRKVSHSAEVGGEIEVPAPQAGRDLSDLEFAWADSVEAGNDVFRRGSRTVIPNPERLYGRYARDLRAWFVARGPGDPDRPWHWIARMLDARGRLLAERESTATAARFLQGHVQIGVGGLPAGGYDLELKAWQEGDAGALLRRSHFSVAWQPDSWLKNPRDIEDNVHFLLDSDAEEAFARLHPGEQEAYLDEFWRVRDPDPDTPANEARDTFLRRVEIANRTYANFGAGKGMFSDMGRVYIRYGEPGEVLHQVIPAGDNTLDQVLRDLSLSEDRDLGEVQRKGLGGDIRPYEVWIYDGEIPLPPDSDPTLDRNVRRKRLLFLFVDEHGHGNYTLRYSSE